MTIEVMAIEVMTIEVMTTEVMTIEVDDNRSDDDDENDNDDYHEGDGNGRGGGDDENSVTFEQTSACPSLFRMVDSLSSFHPLLLTMSLPHSPTLWKVTLPCMWSSFSMLQLDIIMLSYLM